MKKFIDKYTLRSCLGDLLILPCPNQQLIFNHNMEFMNVGKVVGQKPGSFSLWEDKHTLKGLDFAWHLDKITGVLNPFILSSSWKTVSSLPKPLNCRSESFWY